MVVLSHDWPGKLVDEVGSASAGDISSVPFVSSSVVPVNMVSEVLSLEICRVSGSNIGLMSNKVEFPKLLGILTGLFVVECGPDWTSFEVSCHSICLSLLVGNVVSVPFDSVWVNLLGILGSLSLDLSKLVLSISNNLGLMSSIDECSSGALIGNHLGLPCQLFSWNNRCTHLLIRVICFCIISKLVNSILNLW